MVKESSAYLTAREYVGYIDLSTSELTVRINRDPCLLLFYDREGNLISRDAEPMKWKKTSEGYSVFCTKEMLLEGTTTAWEKRHSL